MPALVHLSSRLTGSPGVSLVSHSIGESTNGLITVSCKYVARTSRTAELDAMFFPDAPPPIYPDTINRRYLLGGRLFMTNRSIVAANGLATISAEYISGLSRSANHAQTLVQRETNISVFIPITFGSNGVAVSFVGFIYTPTPVTQEYIRVGNETSGTLKNILETDVYELVSAVGTLGTKQLNADYARNILGGRFRTLDTLLKQPAPSVQIRSRLHYVEEIRL